MCLILTKQPRKNVAKKDIKVMKVLKPDNLSYYRDFKYEVGKTYNLGQELEVLNYKMSDFWYIYEGFHSFYDGIKLYNMGDFGGLILQVVLKNLLLEGAYYSLSNIVAFCTIPKGAKYYHDAEKGLYVSDSIRIDETMTIVEYIEKNPNMIIS